MNQMIIRGPNFGNCLKWTNTNIEWDKKSGQEKAGVKQTINHY